MTEVKIREALSSHIERLPGDLHLLTNIDGNDRSLVNSHIVMLRFIGLIDVDKIGLTISDSKNNKNIEAYRISKINHPYKNYIMQKISATFSDIGLPHEYEEFLKLVSSEVQ